MTENKENANVCPSVTELLLSSCSGAIVTSFFVTPFDVVKTRLQVQAKDRAIVKTLCSPYNCLWDDLCFNGKCVMHSKPHFKGTLDAFAKIRKYEGIASLWSGLTPTLVMSVPATVIYFTTYDTVKKKLSSNPIFSARTFWISFVSGITARVLTVTVISPIEFLRTKIQAEKINYSKTFQSLVELVKHKGVISLWRGWVPTLMRDAPFSAIYWSTYEQLKLLQGQSSIWKTFICGAISGSIAAFVTLPFDVIKTHRQAELGEEKLLKNSIGKSIKFSLLELYRKGGANSLFAGLVPRLMKIAPACAIMITFYEIGKAYFVKKKLQAQRSNM